MKPTSVVVAGIIIISFLSVLNRSEAQSYYNEIGFSVISSSREQLSFRYRPISKDMIQIITDDGLITHLPNIQGASLSSGEPGSPSVLTVTSLVTVPDANGFSLLGYTINEQTSSKSLFMAPRPLLVNDGGLTKERYQINKKAYEAIYNQDIVTLQYAGIQRDRHVALLTIKVSYYDNTKRSIEFIRDITVNIGFKSNSALNYSADYSSIATTINHNETSEWRLPDEPNRRKKETTDRQLVLSGSNWLKVAIAKEGIYKIDAAQIASLGFNISKEQIETIKLFGNGGTELSELPSDAPRNIMNEQPLIIKTNGSGELESIVFYGGAANGFKFEKGGFVSWYNHYSDKNFYLLTWEGERGKRAIPVAYSDLPVQNRPLVYTERIFQKEELSCALQGGSGRIWFGGSIFPRSFSNSLNNLDRNGKIKYKFFFSHRADGTGTFAVSESGVNIMSCTISKTSDLQYLDAYGEIVSSEIDASIIPTNNKSMLTVNYSNPKVAGSTPFFNWYEIHYPRSFTPVDNQLAFWTEPDWSGINEFLVNGFSGEILGFEVTQPGNPKLIKNISTTGGLCLFKDSLSLNSPRRYFLASNFIKPELTLTNIGNLRDIKDESEVIIITHKNLLESARKYQDYRKNRKSIVVTTDEIFNEFNSGLPDPTSIRDYLAYRLKNSPVKPKYVVFWGDGHYDYKNIQTKMISYVPTYQSIESYDQFYATKSFSSDDYFTWLNGNDRYNDIIIGRIPVISNDEGNLMVDKTAFYENNSAMDNWRTYLTLVADDSPTSNGGGDGTLHIRQSEALATDIIPQYMPVRKLYLPEYPSENIPNGRRKPRLSEDLLSYINNSGTLTLNWVGHGNPRVWAHEEIFDRDKTIALFKNLNRLFLNTAATCDFARYDMAETRSGAEMMLLSRNGGSIGEFSSTRVVYSYDNALINETFHKELFRRKSGNGEFPDIGEVMFAVKQIRANDNDIKYNYLGDPLIKILIPYYVVRIDSINSKDIRASKDTAVIKAMSKITVKATVINPIDSSQITDFNGLANLTMYDADYTVNITDIDGTIHTMSKYGGALNRGTYQVVNGKISAEFYVPEDISFSTVPGRIFIYGYTEDKRTASGFTRKFKFGGIDTIATSGTKPEINIFLDTLSFKDGDIVSDNPLLIVRVRDEYGVNTSGSGIGHRLEAWIDDSPESIDLTYRTSIATDDIKTVEAKQVLSGLASGIHKIKVRAWNVFNKYSIEEANFRILSGEEGAMLWNVTPYPNPFSDNVSLQFRHNLNQPFTAELSVYDLLGNKVRQINQTVTSVHTSEIFWDGSDDLGSSLSYGQFVLRLSIFTHKGNATSTTGAVLIK
jgi:hypothetical protein